MYMYQAFLPNKVHSVYVHDQMRSLRHWVQSQHSLCAPVAHGGVVRGRGGVVSICNLRVRVRGFTCSVNSGYVHACAEV